jgi:multidrug efflux pump
VSIDRDTAGRLGITPQNIDDALYDSFGQRQVSTIYTQTNQFHVILEVAPQYQQDTSALRDMYVPIGSASANLATTIALAGTNSALTGAAALAPAPLNAFVRASMVPSPITINHQSQFPVVTLSFNLAPGASLGAAVEHIKQVTQELGMPASIEPSFQGTARAFELSLANESILILAAMVTVYLVLGVLYESFIHPITILSTLPSAGVGAILALVVFKKDLDVIALIGIILLIGIVKKNAIMMIDFALEADRKEGKPPEEAIYQACLLRFRPIMMTTMAALLGAVPLAFGSGVGSELRQPLGICIIGGLLVSQVLTLFTTPVIYLFFGRLAAFVARLRGSDRNELVSGPALT